MNYAKIYYDLCEYCRNTDIRCRIEKRDANDPRLLKTYIYKESHHILPRHAGGSDEKYNLVDMLPEEHLLAHLLRYKAYNSRSDFLAVRFMINGFMNKSYIHEVSPELFESKSFLKKIGLFKQLISEFRKEHGWHTQEGVERISEARKGTFPCIDVKTGESMGSHPRNHPKILSGEWVHHSKGKTSVTVKATGERKYLPLSVINQNRDAYIFNSGQNYNGSDNPNFKELTPERKQRLFDLVEDCVEEGHLLKKLLDSAIREEFASDFKKVSTVWITNNFGSIQKFVDHYNNERGTNIAYDPYYRPKSVREKIANSVSGKAWVTDGIQSLQVSRGELEDFLKANKEFRLGRTLK